MTNQLVIDIGPIYTFPKAAEIISSVTNIYPHLLIKNVAFPIDKVKKKLLSGEIDLAVIGYDIQCEELEHELLSMDELVVVVRNDNQYAQLDFTDLSIFSNQLFALKTKGDSYEPNNYPTNSERLIMSSGILPSQIIFRSSNIRDLLSAVLNLNYVWVTTINNLNHYSLEGLHIIHLLNERRYAPLWIYWKRNEQESPAIKLLKAKIIEYFKGRNRMIAMDNNWHP